MFNHRLPHRFGLTDAARRRVRTRRGESLIGIVTAIAVGLLVIGGAVAFWVNTDDFGQSAKDTTAQQADALSSVNYITRDVSESSAVLLAENNRLVLLKREADGSRTWVRYQVSGNTLTRQVRTAAPATFDPLDTTAFPNSGNTIGERLTLPTSDSAALFRYTTKTGTRLTTAQLPRSNNAAVDINKVEVAYASQAEKANGLDAQSIELRTAASLNTTPIGAYDPVKPTCPTVRWRDGDPYAEMEWNLTGQTTGFLIERTGGGLPNLVGSSRRTYPSPVNTDQLTYVYTDTDVAGVTQAVTYRVIAVGPGGESTNCAPIIWYPRLATPNVTLTLTPATPLASDWPNPEAGSTPRVSTVNGSWPRVNSATYYEVYRRAMYAQDKFAGDYTFTGDWVLSRTIPATAATSYSFTETLPADTAMQYRVVAWGPMPEPSPLKTAGSVLAHSAVPGAVTADLNGRGSNRLRWNNVYGETATEIGIYRSDTSGCFGLGAWTRIATVDLDTNTYIDTAAGEGTNFRYAIAAVNYGPRGTVNGGNPVEYSSAPGVFDQQLQYPKSPDVSVQGSSGGPHPDAGIANRGVNVVNITQRCDATTVRYVLTIWANRANGPVRVVNPAPTTYSHTNLPRATRYYYKAVAYNAIGDSANNASGSTTARPGTQYPNRPDAPSTSSTGVYNSPVPRTLGTNSSNPAGPQETCSGPYQNYNYRYEWQTKYRTVPSHIDEDGNQIYKTEAYQEYVLVETIYVSDTWYCDRWYEQTTLSWSSFVADDGDANRDGSRPDERFCADGSCTYTATFYYTYYNGNTGVTSGPMLGTCSATSSAGNPTPSSCAGPSFGGTTRPHDINFVVNSTYPLRLRVTNAGGSAISTTTTQPPVCPGDPTCAPPPSEPPAPVAFQVVGSEVMGASTNRNRIYFAASPGATSYQIVRYNAAGSPLATVATVTSPSGPGIAGYPYSVNDDARPHGSEFFYRVIASNASGSTPSVDMLPGYQLPIVTGGTAAQQPNNLTQVNYDQVNGKITWSWGDTIDVNGPRNFCDVGVFCEQRLEQINPTTGVVKASDIIPHGTLQATVDVAAGSQVEFRLKLCNPGGCREQVKACNPVCTAPLKPTKLVRAYSTNESLGVQWLGSRVLHDDSTLATFSSAQMINPTDGEAHKPQNSSLRPEWTTVKGAVSYRVGRTPLVNDPFNRVHPAGYTAAPGTGLLGNISTPAVAARWNSANESDQGGQGRIANAALRATPGAVYLYDIYAISDDGQVFVTQFKIMARPAKISGFETTLFCNGGLSSDKAGRWKLANHYVKSATSYDAGAGGLRTVAATKFKNLTWAGQLTADEWSDAAPEDRLDVGFARAIALANVDVNTGDASQVIQYTGENATADPTKLGTAGNMSDGYSPDGDDNATPTYTDWKPDTWNSTSKPGWLVKPGLWSSQVPGAMGDNADGSENTTRFGGNDSDLSFGSAPRIVAVSTYWTWINPNAAGYTNLDYVQFTALGNRNGMALSTGGESFSTPGNCSTSSGWGPSNDRERIVRWASEYSGFTNTGRLGASPTASQFGNVSP